MRKEYKVLIICAVILSLCFVGAASAETWYVDDDSGADFTKIQDAVSAASDGDTIIVRDGMYIENIKVDRRLTIKSENGADKTVIQAANSSDHVFAVTAGHVNISEFTVEGATEWLNRGICLYFADYCAISNNICLNNSDGIALGQSTNNHITNNTCSYNNDDGIYLYDSSNNTITGNNVSNNDDGISLYGSSNNSITGNNANSNYWGISLHNSSNNAIYLNNIISNTYNVYSSELINIWNSTEEITYTYSDTAYTNFLGNYWDDYTGTDADGDGIGKTSYQINKYSEDKYPLIEPFENYKID